MNGQKLAPHLPQHRLNLGVAFADKNESMLFRRTLVFTVMFGLAPSICWSATPNLVFGDSTKELLNKPLCTRSLKPNKLFEIFTSATFDRPLSESEREDLDFLWRFDLSSPAVRQSLGVERAKDSDEGLTDLLYLQRIELDAQKISPSEVFEQKAFRVRILRIANTIRRYESVILNSRGARYFHGSSSASLPSLMGEFPTGLVPTGKMMAEGKVPFTGEMIQGINSAVGVNLNAISTCATPYLDRALNYAMGLGARRAWTLEESRKRVAENERQLKELATQSDSSQAADEYRKLYVRLIEVERLRQKEWGKLSDIQKKLIQLNFPVLYGIRIKGPARVKAQISRTGTWEHLIVGGASPLEIVSVFVPREFIPQVKEVLGNSIAVFPLDEAQAHAMNYSDVIRKYAESFFEGE